MSVNYILAPIDGGKSSHIVLNAAFELAKSLSAHVRFLHVLADPKAAIPLLGEGMSGALIEDMITSAETEIQELRSKAHGFYTAAIDRHGAVESSTPDGVDGLSVEWCEATGREDDVIARFGRLSDLILIPKPERENEIYSTLALNAALFETGRPMLLLPGKPIQNFGKVVSICWNGSMEGARAVLAALPILTRAEKVYGITADTDVTATPIGEELASYLAWHGVDCESIFFSPAGDNVGHALLKESHKLGADVMVMGGYTHSRMRELILGGVTRDVIETADIPVFMGH